MTFRDYALAVLRSEQVANPTDPAGYRALMLECFISAGILKPDRADNSWRRRLCSSVRRWMSSIPSMRSPPHAAAPTAFSTTIAPSSCFLQCGSYRSPSRPRQQVYARGPRLPEQIVVQYIWREELPLEGERFGRFAGERTTMLCGATHGARPERQPDPLGTQARYPASATECGCCC